MALFVHYFILPLPRTYPLFTKETDSEKQPAELLGPEFVPRWI